MSKKIRKNDQVIVITGKYKGKQGVVLNVLEGGKRFLVEGINLIKKHVKPNPNIQEPGGIIEKEAPIQCSNVAIFNPTSGKADRVGFKIVDGEKKRYFKSNNELVDL